MPYLWTKPKQQPFFSQAKRFQNKEMPTIDPDPIIINKKNIDNELVNYQPNKASATINEEPKKERKKKQRLPGEKMLKKLVNHKDNDAEKKKLKAIVSSIKRHIGEQYDVDDLPF